MNSLIILLILSLNSWGQTQEMFKDVAVKRIGDKIKLTAANCTLLKKQVDALNLWSKKQIPYQSKNCICKNSCSYDVSKIVPDFVLKSQSMCPLESGPNCWNSSLVSAGLNSTFRYSSDREMKHWLNSELCSERKNEPPEPGDIIAIRDIEEEEIHAFVHVTDELSFSKNGYTKASIYSLQSPENVYKSYRVTPECRGLTFEDAQKKVPYCHSYSNYFKCRSFNEYLAENTLEDQDLIKNLQELNKYECEFNALMADGKSLDQLYSILDFLKLNLKIMNKMAEDKSNHPDTPEKEKFLWRGIFYKTDSLYEQYLYLFMAR